MSRSKPTPMFEGSPVQASEIALTGKCGQVDKRQAFHIGDEVTLLVTGAVKKIEHGETDGILIRAHKVKASRAYVLDEAEAVTLLEEARERDRRLEDEILGRNPLPFERPDGDGETGEIP